MNLAVVSLRQRGDVAPSEMGKGRDVVEIKIDGSGLHGCPMFFLRSSGIGQLSLYDEVLLGI